MALVKRTFCPNNEFLCSNGEQCIPNGWVCDRAKDCSDGSDEVGCGGKQNLERVDVRSVEILSPPVINWNSFQLRNEFN